MSDLNKEDLFFKLVFVTVCNFKLLLLFVFEVFLVCRQLIRKGLQDIIPSKKRTSFILCSFCFFFSSPSMFFP